MTPDMRPLVGGGTQAGGRLWRVLRRVIAASLALTAAAQGALGKPHQPSNRPFYQPGPHLAERDAHGRLLVLATVDGYLSLPFLLDSGAAYSVLGTGAINQLGLRATPGQSRRVYTAGGAQRRLVYPVSSIKSLGVRLPMRDTVALPLPLDGGAQGIIGTDLLRGHILAYFGAEDGVDAWSGAYLFRSISELPDLNWTVYQGRPVGRGSLALDLSIGAIKLPAIVDTGAARSVINGPARDTLAAEGLRATEETVSVVSTGGQVRGRVYKAGDAQISGVRHTLPDFVAADLPVFTRLGARNKPAAILGMDFLEGRSFALDLRGWQLFFRRSQKGH